MATVEIDGETYTVTDDEKAEWQNLVASHIDPRTAIAIATGEFQDIDPQPEPDSDGLSERGSALGR